MRGTSSLITGLLVLACFHAALRTSLAAEDTGDKAANAAGDKGANAPPVKTVITGARMNLIQKGAAVEFTGGVTMQRGPDLLKADRMVSDEKNGLTQAWGRVYLRRDDPAAGARWEAWSEEAQYAKNLSSGTLWGKKEPARVLRKPLSGEGEQLEMRGYRITFYEAAPVAPSTSPAQVVEAEKRVYVRMEEEPEKEGPPSARVTEIWAGRCEYDGRLSSTTFTGGYGDPAPESAIAGRDPAFPLARQREDGDVRELTGESVTYMLDERRLLAEGNVRAVILGREEKRKRASDR